MYLLFYLHLTESLYQLLAQNKVLTITTLHQSSDNPATTRRSPGPNKSVQRRATRLVPGIDNLNYEDRLKELYLPTLEYRRRRGRMIEVYKILNECYDRKATEGLFELNERETRGNPYQLKTKKPRLAIRKNIFALAAVADWNSLPETVVRCDNVYAFKRSLDRHWEHKMFNTEFLVRNGLT